MEKYDNLKTLKKTKARTGHTCDKCGKGIANGDIYYREHIENRFLHSLHTKKYCSSCYEKFGRRLLSRYTSIATTIDVYGTPSVDDTQEDYDQKIEGLYG